MFVRRAATMLLVAGFATAACGGSEDPAVLGTAAPVEESSSADGTEAAASEAADSNAAVSEAAEPPATSDAEADEPSNAGDVQMFPDVIGATATTDGSTWTVSATLSSPYDTSERYADAWRVVGPDGTVYGERILTHDHASEQPFTRYESGIEIPDDVAIVTIEGRDQEFGYGGDTFELTLPR